MCIDPWESCRSTCRVFVPRFGSVSSVWCGGLLLLCLSSFVGSPSAYADVHEAVWEAMKERRVLIEKNDGSEVRGRLVGTRADVVTVIKEDGRPVVVRRADVAKVRVLGEPMPTPAAYGGDPSSPREGLLERNFVGLLMRPLVCAANCGGTGFSFGPEVGTKVFAFALRYGYANGHLLFLDFRFHYEFELHRYVSLGPIFEIAPTFGFAAGGFGSSAVFQIGFRPGLRANFHIRRDLSVFFEPFAVDIAPFAVGLSGGGGTTAVVVRYNLGFGVQYRH